MIVFLPCQTVPSAQDCANACYANSTSYQFFDCESALRRPVGQVVLSNAMRNPHPHP